MNLLRLIGTIAILFSFAFPAFSETLKIVGDSSAKPKNWLDANGEPRGIMIDLLSEVSLRTGIIFEYQLSPWKRAFKMSEKGQGAIIGFSKTSERLEKWDYSEPMYFDELVFVTTKDKQFEYRGLKSLSGKRLAIKSGASYGDDFERANELGFFEKIETIDRTGQMRMLSSNRVDLVLLSPGRVALETEIAKNDWLVKHKDNFVILSPPYKEDPNYLGIPKSMKQSHLLPKINKALAEIKTDGTHAKIVERNIEKVVRTLRNKN